jgi:microcystin-dependent protein
MGDTNRLKLPWVDLSDGADAEVATRPLAEALDTAVLITTGSGAPPTPSPFPPAGCIYMRSMGPGAVQLYMSDGATWVRLGVQGGLSPIGSMMAWASVAAPADPEQPSVIWRLCNGDPLLIADFPEYNAVVGNKWGGDVTHVNVPDLRGRSLIGADRGAGRITDANNVLGKAAGAEKVAIGVNEMPSHNHSGVTGADQPAHTHGAMLGDSSYNVVETSGAGPYWFNAATGVTQTGTPNVQHNHVINPQGGGVGHPNLPPYAVVDWYIRIK